MRAFRLPAARIIALTTVALACDHRGIGAADGGDTDAPLDATLNLAPMPGMCSVADSPPLALDDVTTLGFAAEDVLPWLTAQHDGALMWAPGTQDCSVTPQGASGIHILVTPHTDAITMGSMREGQGDLARCRPVLSIPCQLSIWTDDDGIDEHGEALIAVPSVTEARFWLDLPPWGGQAAAGSMAMTCKASEDSIPELTFIELAGTITPAATNGAATFHGAWPGIVSISVPVAAWASTPADAGVD